MDNQQLHHQTAPHHQPAADQPPAQKQSAIKMVERITVWVMVFSAIFFALISILAIWGAFNEDSDDIVGKSLGTLAVIAFTALVVNVGANMLDAKKK